jgi:hypothetical protein
MNYLIVVRSYNDIDHITPLIDMIAKDKGSNLYLYSSVHLGHIYPNENLEYLYREYGIKPRYLLSHHTKNITNKMESMYVWLVRFFRDKILTEKMQIIIRKMLGYMHNFVYYLYKSGKQDWANDIFKKTKPDVVLYDVTNPLAFPYSHLTYLVKDASIPLVALPHGIWTFINNDFIDNSSNNKTDSKRESFDWYMTNGDIGKKQLMDSGVSKNKILEFGSLRYDINWVKKYQKLYPNHLFKMPCNGLKVVVFPNKIHYKVNIDELKLLLIEISKNSDCILLKPHTRGMKLDFLKEVIDSNNISVIDRKTPSASLIEWADVILLGGGSIGIQAIINKKPVLNLAYTHDNYTIYDKYLPTTICNNLESVVSELKKIKDGSYCNYAYSQSDIFIKDLVYAGNDPYSVSEKYLSFFKSLN